MNRTANHSAWRYVDERKDFEGSSLRGQNYRAGCAPSSAGTWLSGYEAERYEAARERITYIVWSFYTPIAWWSETYGWYKVGQRFSPHTGRHRSGALRNVPGHTMELTGSRGDWTLRCSTCKTERHFTRHEAASEPYFTHGM